MVAEHLTNDEIEAIPSNLKIGKPSGGSNVVPDVIAYDSNGPFFFSSDVKRILDDLEPGRHRYVEVKVVSDVPQKGN